MCCAWTRWTCRTLLLGRRDGLTSPDAGDAGGGAGARRGRWRRGAAHSSLSPSAQARPTVVDPVHAGERCLADPECRRLELNEAPWCEVLR